MKKAIIVFLMATVGLSFLIPSVPAFAESKDGCVNTIILGGEGHQVCDKDGESIYALLNLVIDIMTIGAGILGVIGISITGVQYLTAGGNEEQTRKAKRRLFEIIIGLAVYATFFMLMQWLINDFEIKEGNFGSSGETSREIPGIYL